MSIQPRHEPEFDCGSLASRLVGDYVAYHAAITIARDSRAEELLPAIEPGQLVPVGRILDLDGTPVWEYHFPHHFARARAPGVDHEYNRVWWSGALLTLGDALAQHHYFDHAPELEMVRHLRNAVAHGNRFDITRPEQLRRYPAHTKRVAPPLKPPDDPYFEITPELHGASFMFDYMQLKHIMPLFMVVGHYLLRIAYGKPGPGQGGLLWWVRQE